VWSSCAGEIGLTLLHLHLSFGKGEIFFSDFAQFGETMALSPAMTSKLKNRDCVNKIRHGSPKLQEVLREVGGKKRVNIYLLRFANR